MDINFEDKELHLIREISLRPNITQRQLSENVGLSLGMTNLLLKRLAQKGFVKVRQLNWNKVQYILTPKGMLEKTRKSFLHAAWTLQNLRAIVHHIQEILLEEHRKGRREFYIISHAEAAGLVEMALEGINLYAARIHRIDKITDIPEGTDTVFIASEELPISKNGTRCVSLMEEKGAIPA